MSLSKKHFIALADELRVAGPEYVKGPVLVAILRFCKSQNPNFKEDRFLGYLRGENGPSGGAIKKQVARSLGAAAAKPQSLLEKIKACNTIDDLNGLELGRLIVDISNRGGGSQSMLAAIKEIDAKFQ